MSNGMQKFSILRQNIAATSADANTKKWMRGKPQLCWKCQKDKQSAGGSFKFFGGGVRRFVCRDCIEAKQAAIAKATGAA